MVDPSVVASVKSYLDALPSLGIHATRAILFGSFARGTAREFSDIDLVVLAPEFDQSHPVSLVKALWQATAVDCRIEPIPCGEQEWLTDGGRPILEIAKREGIVISGG